MPQGQGKNAKDKSATVCEHRRSKEVVLGGGSQKRPKNISRYTKYYVVLHLEHQDAPKSLKCQGGKMLLKDAKGSSCKAQVSLIYLDSNNEVFGKQLHFLSLSDVTPPIT